MSYMDRHTLPHIMYTHIIILLPIFCMHILIVVRPCLWYERQYKVQCTMQWKRVWCAYNVFCLNCWRITVRVCCTPVWLSTEPMQCKHCARDTRGTTTIESHEELVSGQWTHRVALCVVFAERTNQSVWRYVGSLNKCGCVSNHRDTSCWVNKEFLYHGLSGEFKKYLTLSSQLPDTKICDTRRS